MKISRVEAIVLKHQLSPDESFAYSQARYDSRSSLLCKITCDEGTVGWGEAFGPSQIHKTIIDSAYTPVLVGRDPFDTEVIWNELYNMLRDHGQKGLSIESLSAVDIALWDIKGKVMGLPVYQLMGGTPRDRVKPYATGMYRRERPNELELLVDESVSYVDAGFLALKIKIGFGEDYDVAAVKAVREAVGDSIDIMVDANHAYDTSRAIAIGRKIEKYRIEWFEEPVPPEDIAGYREVKTALTIPISGGEAEFTRWGFHQLLSNRAVSIAQPDCTVTGGLSEFQKIVTVASIHGIQVYPHVWGSAVALQTGLHAAFSLPDFPPSLTPRDVYFEFDQTRNIFRETLSRKTVEIEDGYIYPPTGDGLGLDINEEIIDTYRIG